MFGAQESEVPGYRDAREWFSQFVGADQYDELDLDGGDLKLDLNDDLIQLSMMYRTVINIGTIEHVWDAAQAWANALRAVEVGGQFLTHTPIGGWVDDRGRLNHGLHMTRRDAIEAYLTKNGFEITEVWDTMWRTRGRILWLRSRKTRHVTDFSPVYQVRGFP